MTIRESSLKSILGVCVNQGYYGNNDLLRACRDIGFNWVRISASHDLVEPTKGQYDWAWLDAAVNEWLELSGGFPPFLSLYGIPKWISPLAGSFDVNYVPYWSDFVNAITERYWYLPDWGVTCETNIKGGMKQSKEEFMEYVLIPAALAIHDHGKRVIATGTTCQWWESRDTRDRARRHFSYFYEHGEGFIDKHDFHSYGTSGKSVCLQNMNFMYDQLGGRYPNLGELWCTETGFSNSRDGVPRDYTGDAMLHKYQNYIPWLWKHGGWFERVFLYRAWDGAQPLIHRNGILDTDFRLGPSALYLKEELAKIIEVPNEN